MKAGAQLTKRGVPRLLSVGAISEATSVPASTWYTIIARGELPAVKIGRAVRVRGADLLAFIAAHRERAS